MTDRVEEIRRWLDTHQGWSWHEDTRAKAYELLADLAQAESGWREAKSDAQRWQRRSDQLETALGRAERDLARVRAALEGGVEVADMEGRG